MAIAIKVGENIPLAVLLENLATDRFVKATVRDNTGAQIVGSPFNVPHLSDGYYFLGTVPMPAGVLNIDVQYVVYDDAGFTTISIDQLPATERFDVDDVGTLIVDLGSATDALIAAASQVDLQIEIVDEGDLQVEVDDTDEMGVTIVEDDILVLEGMEDDEMLIAIEPEDLDIEMEDC